MGVCITGVDIPTGGKFCLVASLGLENCEVIEKRLFLKFELKSVIRNFLSLKPSSENDHYVEIKSIPKMDSNERIAVYEHQWVLN